MQIGILWILITGVWFPKTACAAPQEEDPPAAQANRPGFLVRVNLPIDQKVREQVATSLDRIIDQAPVTARLEERPVIVLQFDTERGQTGLGSNMADCLDLATRLTSERMSRCEMVSYVPGLRNQRLQLDPANVGKTAALKGHAVLVALATQRIYLEPQVKLGKVLSDNERADSLVLEVYRNLASRRLIIPLEVANSLVDHDMSLYRVTTVAGEELVSEGKFRELESSGKVIQSETLKKVGELAEYSVTQLAGLSPHCLEIPDRRTLAARLRIASHVLANGPVDDQTWKAVRFELPEVVDSRTIDWGVRALDKAIQREGHNLIILQMSGGSAKVKDALRLARYLAELDSETIRTVAYVKAPGCAGPMALVAASCQHLILDQKAAFGGAYSPQLTPELLSSVEGDLSFLAESCDRDVGLLRSLIDMKWPGKRYVNQQRGEYRWLTAEDHERLPDARQWVESKASDWSQALPAAEWEDMGVARNVVDQADELDRLYHLEVPAVLLKPTSMDRFVGRFATFLASPFVSFWLLMAGIMLLSTESSTPGLGLPGFLGTLCIVLFFWSQYFDGNATWLEILMFVTGAIFVLIELFVLPGFGIFGLGGLLLMIVSVVLATQTFIIPRTQQDFAQLPVSLGMALAAALGLLSSLVFLKFYARRIPLFQSMMLDPPEADVFGKDRSQASTAVHIGQLGQSLTPLIPSGKAKIAGQILDVLTEGTVVEPQVEIEVIEVIGNRIVVRPVEGLNSQS